MPLEHNLSRKQSEAGKALLAPATIAISAQSRRNIFLLAVSVALMMTGFGIVLPIFARRLGALGGGVAELGYLTIAFGIGQMLFATLMGSLADRLGRKPLILLALAAVVVANIAYVFVESIAVFAVVRFLQGAITAGLLPATMGMVADLVPEQIRARWIGVVMGSYEAGFIFGPTAGGLLYDHLGLSAPFLVSAGCALLALIFAAIMLPETRSFAVRAAATVQRNTQRRSFSASLPRPLAVFALLLTLDFALVFTFALVEPRMIFFFYNQLGLSATDFGLVIGAYGLASVLGQWLLGRVSDGWGRRWPIMIGFLLNAIFTAALIVTPLFWALLLTAALAGVGVALITPALSAAYLDAADEAHRARVMGFKETAIALGFIAGPLFSSLTSRSVSDENTFVLSVALTVAAALLALQLRSTTPLTRTS